MLMERIKVDFEHQDERGTLTQLFHKGYSQVNVITSKGGVFRGGHYHKLNTEAFYIIKGSCKVTVSKNGESREEVFREGDYFRIGPYVLHDFDYLEDTTMVSMYSLGVELDDGTMDTYTPE